MQLEAGDCRFNVAIDGPAGAPWLVLSHALGATLEMWQPQVRPLSERFRLVRYDVRGHGGSDVPAGEYSMSQLGTDVLHLLDALGVGQAAYCGLSMGGATGLWLAAHAPDRFTRYVICSTSPWLGPPGTMNARIETVRREGLRTLVDATMQRWFTTEFHERSPQFVARTRAEFLATSPAGYAACCAALRDHDEREHLARIEQPVLIVTGTYDSSPPPTVAREYAGRIGAARVVELPAAHLVNCDAAERFNEAVMSFLSEQRVTDNG